MQLDNRPGSHNRPGLLLTLSILFVLTLNTCAIAPKSDLARWEARAARVEIIRDDWGIPHIYAPTDADAIFGLIYAQAEDDFPRIERNFLFSQGRLAEAEGETALWQDLRMRLFIDPSEMKALYDESPAWLRELMDAWADGLNYFLHTHPEVEPRALDHFEPWMALTFSEGSIGGDIERVNVRQLQRFYEEIILPGESAPIVLKADDPISADSRPNYASALVVPDPDDEPRGSNGIAIAPELTRDGNALLLINPHTTFYFRHEAHVVSEEGLNAYGALTWGQFFIYQGFNETAGWMHTTSSADNIDEFLETIVEREDGLYYLYGDEERPVETKEVTIRYRLPDDGEGAEPGYGDKTFTTFRTHHGPIVRAAEDGRWVSVALMEEPLRALIQSYSRTKARNLEEFLEIMEAHTNSSNNTLFADAEGNIAYLHSNFVPRRDDRFDYTRPVDGSDPATDWQGIHTIEESPNAINPSTGFAFCTNNWAYSAAGEASPRQVDYPRYMDSGTENYRGIHARRLLEGGDEFTLESLRELAYSNYLPAFEDLVPALVKAWRSVSVDHPLRGQTAEQVRMLQEWDLRWDTTSIPTTVAIFWGEELRRQALREARSGGLDPLEYAARHAAPELHLESLVAATERLEEDFGSWQVPWGEINRFQRLSGDLDLEYDDSAPSTPVGFTSGRWGALAVFGAAPREGPNGTTKRWYGRSGNSFVAAVEFGPQIRALAITAGGLSNDPESEHFDDQIERYASGDLRPVYFYREDVEAAARERYQPGKR